MRFGGGRIADRPEPLCPVPVEVMDVEVMDRLKPIDVRRAVLSVFMRRGGGPLAIDEIVRLTHELAGLDLAELGGVAPRRRVSDIMRHQVREGRAEVYRRGSYRLFLEEFSISTRWRCLHWRKVKEARGRFFRPQGPRNRLDL